MVVSVRGLLWRCALGVLSGWLVLGAMGCATTQGEMGGSGTASTGLPPGLRVDEVEEATEAEAALLVTQVMAVANATHAQGARLSFTFWNERGALTLISFSARGVSGPAAAALDDDETHDTLATVLAEYPQRHTGQAILTLQREQAKWAMDYNVSAAPRPPEARLLPVPMKAFPAEVVRDSTKRLGKMLEAVEVPTEGEIWLDVEVQLEDGRIEGWRPRLFQLARRGGRPRPVSPLLASYAVQVLLPFTLGVGPRTVLVRLRLAHRAQDTEALGWVEFAQIERPQSSPETNAAFVAEYRAMHEYLLWKWRYEVREGAEWIARRGAEEMATWYAGGVLLRGGGYLARWAGSATRRALARGGEAATGWLRTTLSRLPGDKKREFEWLWAKVQLEGERALTAGEKASLRGLMERVEQLVHTRLDIQAKKRLRDSAREYYKTLHPELRQLLEEQGAAFPIHHRRPLDYAQLFPAEDINAADNLVMVKQAVHGHVNRAWARFKQLRPDPTATEVSEAAKAIDARFHIWYHQAGDPRGAALSLGDAERAALQTLERLFPN